MDRNDTSTIHIAFITDNNFVIPTSVAISSIIESKEPATRLCIHVVCASLSDENEAVFHSFASDTVEIDIILQDADRFFALHKVVHCNASRAALLKFVLPELLPDCDRVLYLDGDILVKGDLTELYNVELADNYAACVLNSFTFFRAHYTYEDKVGRYFNSGVMVLNLRLMREDAVTDRLIAAKQTAQRHVLMDQIAFNYVFDKRISVLPVRYNFQILCLPGVKGDREVQVLNEHFGTQYRDLADLLADAVVVHFASRAKPWKNPTALYSEEWYETYQRSPVSGQLPPLSQIYRSALEAELNKIRGSWSYRIGRAITWLPRTIQSGIRCYKNRGFRYAWNRLLVRLHLKHMEM